jgi:hypothetical protein
MFIQLILLLEFPYISGKYIELIRVSFFIYFNPYQQIAMVHIVLLIVIVMQIKNV